MCYKINDFKKKKFNLFFSFLQFHFYDYALLPINLDDGIWLDEFARLNAHEDYQDEDIVEDPRRTTEVAFLVNGCYDSKVTAAAYTAVLPFAYFPSLRASLLEFPLDVSMFILH